MQSDGTVGTAAEPSALAPGEPGAYSYLSFEGAAFAAICIALAFIPLALVPETNDAFRMPKQLILLLVVALIAVGLTFGGARLHPSKVFRYSLLALIAAEFLAFAFAFDIRGSVLGAHGTRLGIVTQLALIALLAGTAAVISTETAYRRLAYWGLGGVVLVIVYAALQRFDADPLDWANPAIFSTFGNQNEAASYFVLALALLPALIMLTRDRLGPRAAAVALLVPVLLFEVVILWTNSRMGLVALAIGLASTGVLALAGGWARTTVLRAAAAVAVVLVVGVLVTIPGGDASTVWSRFGRAAPADASGAEATDSLSIRLDIWKGSLAVIGDSPIVGVGQVGTRGSFDRERPEDLGNRFAEATPTGFDPAVDSAHSFLLDVPAQLGLVGAAVVSVLSAWLAWRYWLMLRRREACLILPFIGGAFVGFAAYAAINPLNLTTLAVLAILIGVLVGFDTPHGPPRTLRSMPRGLATAGAGLFFFATLIFSGMQLIAEVRFADAIRSRGTVVGTDAAAQAASLIPFESYYRRLEAENRYLYGVTTRDRGAAETALREQEQFLDDFPGLALDYLRLAQMRTELGRPAADVEAALADAKRASPYGVSTQRTIDQLRTRLEEREAAAAP